MSGHIMYLCLGDGGHRFTIWSISKMGGGLMNGDVQRWEGGEGG